MKKSELQKQINILKDEISSLKCRLVLLESSQQRVIYPTIYPPPTMPEPFVVPVVEPNKWIITCDSNGIELTKSAYTGIVMAEDNMVHSACIEGVFGNSTELGVRFNWMGTDGYGDISITETTDGTIKIDSEYMSKEFVMEVLKKLVDDAELVSV